MVGLRDDDRSQLVSAYENEADHVHIYGEPGIGKSTLAEKTFDGLLSDVPDSRTTVRETYTPEIVEKEVLEELRNLTSKSSELLSRTSGWSFSLSGLGFGGGAGRSTDERARDIHKIQSLSEGFDQRAVLWLDDVQKISDKRSSRQDCITELSGALPESITFVTSGRTPLQSADVEIELEELSIEGTDTFLRHTFPGLAEETVEEIHDRVDGHPYFLDLLLGAADSPEDLDLPEGDVYSFIEDEYLDTLSPGEERFVRQTSLLTELDESICATVVSDADRATIRQTLDSLRQKAVIRAIDRNDAGERIYSMHDLFRKHLYQRLDNEDELHRRAFEYYVRDSLERTTDPKFAPLTTVGSAIFARLHLHEIYDGEPTVEEVQTELNHLELTLQERQVVLHGIATHLLDSSERSAKLMQAETTAIMEQISAEADVSEPQFVFIQFYLDMFRTISSEDAAGTPVLHRDGYHDELMEEIRSIEWEDADTESIQFFEDIVSASVHTAALATATKAEDAHPKRHKEQLFAITERYGLEAELVREVVALTQEFFEETLPGFDVESAIDPVVEDLFSDAFDSGSTRKNLQAVQDTVPDVLLSLAEVGIRKALSDSEEIFEYCSSVEQVLSDAENPLFVAFWARFCAQIYTVLGPNEERADYFETRFEQAREQRIRYEDPLENPLIEVEEDNLLPEEEFADADAETGLQELVDFE